MIFRLVGVYAGVSVSATKSKISGDIQADIQAFTTYHVNVTAYDNTGTRIYTGGDLFYVEIRNRCTRSDVFTWSEASGTTQVVQSLTYAAMTDHNDGTYSYAYSVNRDGVITISVFLLISQQVIAVSSGTTSLPRNYFLNLKYAFAVM